MIQECDKCGHKIRIHITPSDCLNSCDGVMPAEIDYTCDEAARETEYENKIYYRPATVPGLSTSNRG